MQTCYMKLLYKHLYLLPLTLFCLSCSNGAVEEALPENTPVVQEPGHELKAILASYHLQNGTRVSVNDAFAYKWEQYDRIGVYGESNGTEGNASFRIKQGDGSNIGTFGNDIFRLLPNSTYYALYPYDPDASADACTVSFTGQTQTSNGSVAHIGTDGYMYAEMNTDANGATVAEFKNACAVIQLKAEVTADGTYTSIKLESKDKKFVVGGTLNMKTGEIKNPQYASSIQLSLSNIPLKNGEELKANILVAPTDLSGEVSVSLVDSNGNSQPKSFTGEKIEAGNIYPLVCLNNEIAASVKPWNSDGSDAVTGDAEILN